MKIAIVVPGGLHPSRPEQVVPSWQALFERLAQLHEIHAFVLQQLPKAQSYSLLGFTVHDLGRPSAPFGFTRRAQQRTLARALDQCGPFDLIHGFHADPAGQLAARAGRRLSIPSIVTCDSGEFVSIAKIKYGSQRTSGGRAAVADACKLATKVHVCTTYMAALAALEHIATTVIPLTSVTSEAAMIKWSLTRHESDSFRIVQVARLSYPKNQRLLIDALPIVRERIDARLDLVGEDTLNGELQSHAHKIGVGAHVTFHGVLPRSRVLEVLASADLYVQSSLHEPSGVSVLEAAAAGVPVLGTRAGYVADWSPMKAMALGDAIPESLADAILTLHADPDRRRSMAALARTFSLAQDATWSAAQFDSLYKSLKS
ncbi:MAG TPA: glycosyltransferase family 4 protein [Vicinamibacterales bacterium]|nr:glycosyltransferase family 4 protein [Vicinamibacterales bacterium]